MRERERERERERDTSYCLQELIQMCLNASQKKLVIAYPRICTGLVWLRRSFVASCFCPSSGASLLIASGRLTSKGNPIIKHLGADVESTMTINNLWITYLQHWHHTVRVCAKTLCHKHNTTVINSAIWMQSSCDKAWVEKCQLMTACIDMTLSVN